jgi:hypothetical protein
MMPIMKTSVVLFVEEHSLHRPPRSRKRDADVFTNTGARLAGYAHPIAVPK